MWHTAYDESRIPLLPYDMPSEPVPARYRWYVHNGIAYTGTDPAQRDRCRLKHSTLCPAIPHEDLDPALLPLVCRLRANLERLVRDHGFIPHMLPPRSEAEVAEPDPTEDDDQRPTVRHVLHYYGSLRITPGPLDQLRCVALLDGERCTHPVFDPEEGYWEKVDLPGAPGRQGQMLLSLTGGTTWAFTISPADLSYRPIQRWLRQFCHPHGDLQQPSAGTELISFETLRHGDYALPTPPAHLGHVRREGDISTPLGEDTALPRTRCAGPECRNQTVQRVEKGWLCYACARRTRRRTATHRKWATRAPAPSPEAESPAEQDRPHTGTHQEDRGR